jgi:hypothetical protein
LLLGPELIDILQSNYELSFQNDVLEIF